MKQLVELTTLLPEKNRETTQLLAVSIDSHADSQRLISELKKEGTTVTFPLLEDRDHEVIDRYGILNPQGKGWPHPATYVIDKQGAVQWRFIEVDYKVRPTNAAILAALQALP